MNCSPNCATDQSNKGAMSCCPLPKHPQQKCGQQRSIHERKDKLKHVHDVIESSRNICGGDRDQNSEHRSHASHPQVMLIACTAFDVGLIDVIRPDCIE